VFFYLPVSLIDGGRAALQQRGLEQLGGGGRLELGGVGPGRDHVGTLKKRGHKYHIEKKKEEKGSSVSFI